MKVEKFNLLFRRAGEFQLKHKFLYLIVISVITLICCLGLPKINLNANEESWFSDWDTVKITHERFEDLFGSEDSIMAFIEADNVFDPEVLDAIDRLGKRLESEVPYGKSVTSLTSLSIPKGTEEGFNLEDPFKDFSERDYSDSEIQEKKNFIMSRDSLVNTLVSDDCKETWVILSLENYTKELSEAMFEIAPPAMEIFNSPEFKSDKYTIKPTGESYTEYEETLVTKNELGLRIGIGFIVMVVCLIIFVHSLRGVIVPCIATGAGICSVLGLSGWIGAEGSDEMLALPVLLAMALSIGYAIHYVNEFRLHFRKTGLRKESVLKSFEEAGWPLFFTVVTTAAGLISFLFADIQPLRWVGGCSAACVFAVYIYVIILIPIFLSFGKDKKLEDKQNILEEKSGATKTDLAIQNFGSKILNAKYFVLIFSLIVIVFMSIGIFKTKVNMDYTEMMGEKTPYVARLLSILKGKLGSQYSYNVFIEFEEENALKSSDVLKRMDKLSDKLGGLDTTKVSGSKARVTSITQLVKEMNRTLFYDLPENYIIPDDDDLVTQEMFIYEISEGGELFDWVSEDYSSAYIHVEMNGYDAEKITNTLDSVESFCKEIFPEAKTSVVGEVVNYAIMNGKIVRGQLKSFIGSFMIILILMAFAFASVHTGLIAMLPNVAPVIMIGGIMGYFHISLDMITMTVMPMILGIAVDDTIHFTNHIKFYYEKGLSYKDSILTSYREIGKTMGMTTIILCSMFVILSFSIMNCFARLGYLSIIGLTSALIADYTLTPVLILLTKPFGKDHK